MQAVNGIGVPTFASETAHRLMEGSVASGTLPRRAFGVRTLAVGVAERRVLLFLGDMLAVNLALAFAVIVLPRPSWLTTLFPIAGLASEWFVSISILWLVASVLADSYDLAVARSHFWSSVKVVWVGVIVLVIYSLVPIITPPLLKSRLMWVALTGCTLGSLVLWRLAYASLVNHPVLARRVLIVGTGESGRLLARALLDHSGSGHEPIGFVNDGDGDVGACLEGVPVVGTIAQLPFILDSTRIDELVVATTGPMVANAYHAISAAYESGIRVTPMAWLYERVTNRIAVEHVGDHWLASIPQPTEASLSAAVLKRSLDILGSVVGLFILVVLFLPIAVAIRLDSPGPVLFSQPRIGRRGHRFKIYKFRTLPSGSAQDGPQSIWQRKLTRATRVGRLLRRTRLDELPQFWNVLIGDMSLVGPRPFVAADIEELQRHIPFFRCRLLVRPGLTGWAQVKSTYGTSLQDELIKLQYDLYYIRHQSIAFDLAVLLKTVVVVFRLAGR